MQRILLLDDEPHVLAALQRVLRARFAGEAGVETFCDPDVALLRIKEAAFDVIMSDYRMPQMTGIEFLRRARALQPHAVRMILSASSDFDTIQKAINEVEVYRFLAKPWSDTEVVTQIRGAFERADQARQERALGDAMRVQQGELSPVEHEKRRLEELEPGITSVEWGPNGEVLMPDELSQDILAPPKSDR